MSRQQVTDDKQRIKILESRILQFEKREKTLTESEKKYRGIFEGSRDGYMMTDSEGRFTECNSSFCEMLGYTAEELRNQTYFSVTPEKWHDFEKDLFRKQLIKERGYTDVYEKEFIRKDSVIFFSEVRLCVVRDNNGGPLKFWGLVRDITEKKRLQDEAIRNARMASVGELAAGVAHEINNPVNCIINYAQILINRSKADNEDTEILKRIIRDGDRIERIVRNLLSLAREQKQKKHPVHIKTVLTESLELTHALLRKDHIRLEVDIQDDLPLVRANPQQIQQVILNIISNARYALNQKYPGADKEKIIKVISRVIDQEKLRTVFYDQGTGIPSDILNRIFDPFFTTKPPNQGTGLGLSLCRGIIEDHHGKLWFETKEGKYAKVIIEIPPIRSEYAP